jgi:hypothetical protein
VARRNDVAKYANDALAPNARSSPSTQVRSPAQTNERITADLARRLFGGFDVLLEDLRLRGRPITVRIELRSVELDP